MSDQSRKAILMIEGDLSEITRIRRLINNAAFTTRNAIWRNDRTFRWDGGTSYEALHGVLDRLSAQARAAAEEQAALGQTVTGRTKR